MRDSVLSVVTASLLFVLPSLAAAQPRDAVAAGYERLYSGDWDEALRQFEALHAQQPQQLPAWFGFLISDFVRLQSDNAVEAAFERSLEDFLAAADARYSRSRTDAEALFYLSHGSMLRAAFRFSEDKGMWGAARDAARAKGYADQYVRQHPEHGDAYLPLGIYNYFVGIAPTFAKVLRVLLFMPGGNRVEGLAQLERAERDGNLFAPIARGLLGNLYGTFEGRLPDAIAISERLAAQYPGNSMVRISLAQLYAHPTVEAYDRAAAEYHAVIERAHSSSLVHLSERQAATLGLAALQRIQWRLDKAIGLLQPALDRPADKPEWVVPTFLLQRANYRMLLNDPRAADDVRRVLGNPKMAKWHKEARQDARTIDAWLQRSADAAVYASLIPGNRLVAEERWDEARAFYEKAGAAPNARWQVQYRLAVLDFQSGMPDRAAGTFAELAANRTASTSMRAMALLYTARVHDLAGRRADAIKVYEQVIDRYEKEQYAANLARAGLLAPYRRRGSGS